MSLRAKRSNLALEKQISFTEELLQRQQKLFVIASVAKQSGFEEQISYDAELLRTTDRDHTDMDRKYCVYIMTNHHHSVLYTGVTNDLRRRVMEHKSGNGGDFTKRYKITKLVYFECGSDIGSAILREKQIKGGSRQKKIDLIESTNPDWKDLAEEII